MKGHIENSLLRWMARARQMFQICLEPAGKAQRAKGNGLKHDIAEIGDTAFGVPETFPTGIVADAVRGAAVVLDSIRVHVEPVGVLVVLKSIDVDGDAIVKVDLLARSHARMNLGGIVFADPAHVEVVAVVGEVGRGGLANGLAVVRVELPERGHHRFCLARRAIQKIGKFGCAVDPWNFQRSRIGCGVGQSREARRDAISHSPR